MIYQNRERFFMPSNELVQSWFLKVARDLETAKVDDSFDIYFEEVDRISRYAVQRGTPIQLLT